MNFKALLCLFSCILFSVRSYLQFSPSRVKTLITHHFESFLTQKGAFKADNIFFEVSLQCLATYFAIFSCSNPTFATQYDKYSDTYDELNGDKPAEIFKVNDLRKKAGNFLQGDVLEVAIGTGLQTSYNSWNGVKSYTGIDESTGMLSQASDRIHELAPKSVPIYLQRMDVQDMSPLYNKFDTVIDTFSICVFDKPQSAVNEMARVLRPGGRLILLENTRSNNPILGFYQDATEPIITPLSKGCKWNVDVPSLVRNAGLRPIVKEERSQFGTFILGVYEKLSSSN